ncbi:hypothetical protein GE061_020101 [Apolygus lucorum]|uniref:Uncharacterized protein n=1 Tax=Apolygus lucorum TaxID=248454 RepID=A0A8S9XEA6_APOLU|nr:hypothetical protein GE061_020101 [Apolygus lucorum]
MLAEGISSMNNIVFVEEISNEMVVFLLRQQQMDLQDVVIPSRRPSVESLHDKHLHPTASYRGQHRPRSRSPSIRRARSPADAGRSPSPRRMYPHHPHHDIGFSDTVSNVVEIVKHEHSHARRYPHIHGSWSASPSPARSPSPTGRYHGDHHHHHHHVDPRRMGGYGTTSLEQRSRSPSPRPHPHRHTQHSYPVLVTRRGVGRRLPPTPNKPSTLQLTPASINFPKLNASPTRNYPGPMSFEQAVAIGRGAFAICQPATVRIMGWPMSLSTVH